MQQVDFAGANDDDVVPVPQPIEHDEDLLSDFRRRLDTALKVVREHQDAARRGEHLR